MSKIGVPMLRDLQPCRYPHPVVFCDVVKKAHQGGCAARPAYDSAVQSDRHHLGRYLSLGVENVKAILQICKKLVAATKALCVDETHIIGVEGVRYDQVGP